MSNVSEYINIIDNIVGTFLDATYGFHLGLKELALAQEKIWELKPPHEKSAIIHDLDLKPFKYNWPDNHTVSETTAGEYKTRNWPDYGRNYDWAAKMALVTIYGYWDEKYRNLIAKEYGFTKQTVKYSKCKRCKKKSIKIQEQKEFNEFQEFDEIRHYRNVIIHNNSKAQDNFNDFTHFTLFKSNEDIKITPELLIEITTALKKSITKHQQGTITNHSSHTQLQ